MISDHAAAAKLIRRQLKVLDVPGSVRASSYAGGTSVTVYLDNVPTETAQTIREFASQFEKGTFDGMTDSYNYDNRRDDIPQVKYIFVQNNRD